MSDEQALPDITTPTFTHRQILTIMSGIVLGMFVAVLSSTVVTNALPIIIRKLDGSQNQYTWIVAITLLVSTATTPLWGKLSDLFNKKVLLQLAIGIFVLGSALSGLSTAVPELIAFRGLQGVGLGGMQALSQIVMAAIISPRQRGRYSGYLGAAFATGTVGGPLIGGLLVDTPWLGWRWCFYVGIPFAIFALVVIQKTLQLPLIKRKVKLDILGSLLLSIGVAGLMAWSTIAGTAFDWISWQSGVFVGVALICLVGFVFQEKRFAEPVIPLRLFANRTTRLITIASVCVGVVLFGGSIFLGQYFLVALGHTATEAGLLSLPLVGGLVITSTGSGFLVTRYGKWKIFLVVGMALLLAGAILMTTVDVTTPLWQTGIFIAIIGAGLGMSMQNMILAVQNSVPIKDLGAATSLVTFFRSLGGAVGVSAIGAVLAHRVTELITEGLGKLGASSPESSAGGSLSDVESLPAPVQSVIKAAYGTATGDIFYYIAPLALIALVCVLLVKEVPLGKTSGIEREAATIEAIELEDAVAAPRA